MNQDQNQKQNPEDRKPDTDSLNTIPPNLPVKPGGGSPTNLVKDGAPEEPEEQKKHPHPLEREAHSSDDIVSNASVGPSSSTPPKIPPLKKAEASNYGRTTLEPIRTYEKDVEEAERRKGKGDTKKPEQKESEKKKAPPREGVVPQKLSKESPEKNRETTQDSIRKKAIEQELAQSGIVTVNTEKNKSEEEKTSISSIKTFRSDAATEVKEKNLSVVSIATAQNKKRVLNGAKPQPQESNFLRNLSIIFFSLALIGSGSGLAWFFYQKSLEGRSITPETTISSFIFSNSQKEIDVTGRKEGLLSAPGSVDISGVNNLAPNTVLHLYHTKTFLGKNILLSTQEFLSRVSPNVPNRLIRSVREEYMLGQYITADENVPFLILKTDSFENTFASMLEWEETIQRDLAPYFGDVLGELTTGSSSNGTSTTRAQIIVPRIFHDVIIKNIDTRLLRNDNGNVALLYSFPNVNTLIITTNEDIFFEIFRRLTTSR